MFSSYQDLRLRSARKATLQRARALTTIYGVRLSKIKRKKMRTAIEDRSEIVFNNDTVPKSRLSPFRPLPAIGKMSSDSRFHDRTKDTNVIVFDITKNDEVDKGKFHDVLKPLTPLRLNGCHRKMSVESLDSKPQQLLRENTYDVIKPIFLSAPKVKKRDSSLPRRILTPMVHNSENYHEVNNNDNSNTSENSANRSPRSRFRKAAMEVGKLSSVPETGKLLCLRKKLNFQPETEEEVNAVGRRCSVVRTPPVSPTKKLSKLSEIFQCLEMKGRHNRDKMKLENNWF